MSVRNGVTVRGTSNGNDRGSSTARRRRKEWLIETYRADVDGVDEASEVPSEWFWERVRGGRLVKVTHLGKGTPAARCYRCGVPCTIETLTADRIKPGCQGGTYRRTNLRPACGECNSLTGGSTRAKPCR